MILDNFVQISDTTILADLNISITSKTMNIHGLKITTEQIKLIIQGDKIIFEHFQINNIKRIGSYKSGRDNDYETPYYIMRSSDKCIFGKEGSEKNTHIIPIDDKRRPYSTNYFHYQMVGSKIFNLLIPSKDYYIIYNTDLDNDNTTELLHQYYPVSGNDDYNFNYKPFYDDFIISLYSNDGLVETLNKYGPVNTEDALNNKPSLVATYNFPKNAMTTQKYCNLTVDRRNRRVLINYPIDKNDDIEYYRSILLNENLEVITNCDFKFSDNYDTTFKITQLHLSRGDVRVMSDKIKELSLNVNILDIISEYL